LRFADPRASFSGARRELIEAFEGVLDSGRYILGEQVGAFEQEWAEFCGTAYAVGLSSGTDALALALRAVGVEPGDEVLVPAMTAVASWMAVSQVGAVPVGVDIEPRRNGMDPEGARAAIGPRTTALVAVHLFGQPADVDALAEVAAQANIPLIEDAAQAHGATLCGRRVGALGKIAAFSFYPTKNLGAIGDAGAVATSDALLADRVRLLREYGWRNRADAELKGINARLDELQAAVLRVMLARLPSGLERRRAIASTYIRELSDIPGLELPHAIDASEHAWHLFVVRHPHRAALAVELSRAGVDTAVHYPTPPPRNTAFRSGARTGGSFPVAERHAETALSLPLHPGLADADVARVISAVHAAADNV
jgi:dTDP-3-amino-3,4,6-trideoxy-alpha-D-glucose transaminase